MRGSDLCVHQTVVVVFVWDVYGMFILHYKPACFALHWRSSSVVRDKRSPGTKLNKIWTHPPSSHSPLVGPHHFLISCLFVFLSLPPLSRRPWQNRLTMWSTCPSWKTLMKSNRLTLASKIPTGAVVLCHLSPLHPITQGFITVARLNPARRPILLFLCFSYHSGLFNNYPSRSNGLWLVAY